MKNKSFYFTYPITTLIVLAMVAIFYANAAVAETAGVQIDPSKTALLIMDYQNDIVKPGGKFEASGLPARVKAAHNIENTKAVLDACREKGIFIIHVRAAFRPGAPSLPKMSAPQYMALRKSKALLEGTWGAEIIDELKPLPDEPVITKRTTSSFIGTDLDLLLRGREISHLVLTGIATGNVVEGTARDAVDLRYLITVIDDCCNSFTDEWHQWPLKNVLSQYATVIDSKKFIESLTAGE